MKKKLQNSVIRDMKDPIEAFVIALKTQASPEKKPAMEAYMKERFSFLGVMNTERKAIQKAYFPVWKKDKSLDPVELAQLLWKQPFREFQYAAMDWMKATSLWKYPGSIRHFESWVLDRSWWDSVDFIASTCMGGYFLNYPAERDAWIEKWNSSPDFWLNRCALLFQLKYKNQVDTDLLFAIIDTHKDQKEFFIRKAIGWALRELSKTQPGLVKDYLERTQLSGLSIREATKYLV
ncbi:MAG TPA: DNA alkylation repair protein [Bacteroidetes bacterium]|nr:DNA alkylation repair protein [Bacteroidota bacterium]